MPLRCESGLSLAWISRRVPEKDDLAHTAAVLIVSLLCSAVVPLREGDPG